MWGSSEEPSCSWQGGEASTQVPARHLHWDVVLTDLHVCTRCRLLPRCMAAARGRSQCRDNTSRIQPSCSPSLTTPQNIPLSAPHLCQPQALSPFHSGIGQQLLFPPLWKNCLLPLCPALLCPPAAGGTGVWVARQACAWPVRPSVHPAAALLRALTSALPAAGRWAGCTAPIVLKIIQQSTNSLQISVTARRN